MIDVIQSILSLLLTLGILVTVHEYGHFWMARRCGVVVLKFSIGFGKSLFSWKDKKGTEFSIASIPLGGYVKMLDEREGPVDERLKEYTFNSKPVTQRIAIAAAGPISNFLFAIIAYWLMFLSGFNVLIPTIGDIKANSSAEESGLKSGYEIVSVDGRETSGWRSVNMELLNRIGDTGDIQMTAIAAPGVEAKEYSLKIKNWMRDQKPGNLLEQLGIQPYFPKIAAVIGQVLPGKPADEAGMLKGDRVFRVNGKKIDHWGDFAAFIHAAPEKLMHVDVYRDTPAEHHKIVRLEITPELYTNKKGDIEGRIGIAAKEFSYPDDMIREVSYGPLSALNFAASQVWADSKMTLNAIKKMIQGLISLDNLSGPITIAQVASSSIKSGSESFLHFLALLSISLGILNLLPIPVLDGGHIFYYLIEGVFRKPVSEKWQLIGLKIGISFILILMSLAFYNDVMRLQQ